MTIVLLPGVTDDTANHSSPHETRAQLRVRIAALEAEVARLTRLLNDQRYLTDRVIGMMNGRTPPA